MTDRDKQIAALHAAEVASDQHPTDLGEDGYDSLPIAASGTPEPSAGKKDDR
jgi:hypothetical protein